MKNEKNTSNWWCRIYWKQSNFELVAQGHEVISIDDYSSGLKENELDGVKYVNLDINLIGQLDESFDICFHLAAKSRVQPSFNDPTEYFRVNVYGTMKIMEWAKKNNVNNLCWVLI